MTKDEALDLALEALELSAVTVDSFGVQKKTQEAITAIKQALAEPVQPAAWESEMRSELAKLGFEGQCPESIGITIKRWLDAYAESLTAQPAPVQPVAWVDLLKQAEEVVRSKSLWKKYIDGTPLANDIAVWMASFAQEHTTLPAQPAPVQPVAFEVGLVEWVGNKLMATPKTTTTPPASWMEMITANLVREGGNKHKARELAEHFYSLAQRPFVGLTDEERDEILDIYITAEGRARAIEAKLRSKNT